MQFNFMDQASRIEVLLKASMAALPHLPTTEKLALEFSMREFETFGAPALWSPSDVDGTGDLGLTDSEKREAIGRFIQGYEIKESDWIAIYGHAKGVLAERQVHIRVEYDTAYTGGNYNGVGEFAYIPLSLVEAFAEQDQDGDDCVELAFTKITKLDSMHIIHYTMDEQYNQDGELII